MLFLELLQLIIKIKCFMVQDLLTIISLRLQQTLSLLEVTACGQPAIIKIINFQFEQHLRRDKQKKIVACLHRLPEQVIEEQEVRQRISSISDQYRQKFRQLGVNFNLPTNTNSTKQELKLLASASIESLQNVRLKIAKKYPNSWGIHMRMNLNIDKLRNFVHQYSQRIGLSSELSNQFFVQNQGNTVNDLLAESKRVNTKIMKSIEQFEQSYKAYKKRQKKRKVKKFLSTQQPQKTIQVKLQKICPLKKYVSQYHQKPNVSPSKKESNKNVIKIALPQALKRIEFPNISGNQRHSYIHSYNRRKQSRKIETMPSQHISFSSKDASNSSPAQKISYSTAIYEVDPNQSEGYQKKIYSFKRLHNIAAMISNSNEISTLRVKKRQDQSKRLKILESPVCFNDEILKKNFDQRFSIDRTAVQQSNN